MGFSLEVFPMGGVHNEFQRPTKKEKREVDPDRETAGVAL
jgi:hypothetical protein